MEVPKIFQYPPNQPGEPTFEVFEQRNEALAEILRSILGPAGVMLAMRAVTPEEAPADLNDIVYGVVMKPGYPGGVKAASYKTVLYPEDEDNDWAVGIVAHSDDEAIAYSEAEFNKSRGGKHNHVRLKPPNTLGGKEQLVARDLDELGDALKYFRTAAPPSTRLAVREHGLVVMPDLEVTGRASIGRIDLGAGGQYCYIGKENLTDQGPNEPPVYHGMKLGIWRADEGRLDRSDEVLREFGIPRDALERVGRAWDYYEGSVAQRIGRLSFDVITGTTRSSEQITTVGDITARVGGGSSAELVGIQALQAESDGLCFAETTMHWSPPGSLKEPETLKDKDAATIVAIPGVLLVQAKVVELRS